MNNNKNDNKNNIRLRVIFSILFFSKLFFVFFPFCLLISLLMNIGIIPVLLLLDLFYYFRSSVTSHQ
jgi:hypothetical protein